MNLRYFIYYIIEDSVKEVLYTFTFLLYFIIFYFSVFMYCLMNIYLDLFSFK